MKSVDFISLLTLGLLSCSPATDQTKTTVVSPDKIISKQYTSVDTSKVIVGDSYYKLTPASDSTSLIIWGTKDFSNTSTFPMENDLIADKLFLEWSNDSYITLGMGTGSDTWYNIILPLTKKSKQQMFYNPFTVDKENELIVYPYENHYTSDTLMTIENFRTNKKQFVGAGWAKCSSAILHYCVDSISITKKQLYIKWVTPNTVDTVNKTDIKKIKIII